MRINHSLINIAAGLTNQVIITALSFVSRTIFITYLGIEYLGINGLFTSILAMLALAEAGVGSSIMYSLYKPVAENDYNKINALMKLYKKAYLVIAMVVFTLGMAIMPFLNFFVKDTNVDNIHLIYFIFLMNTVLPYLYLHKNNFLNVCQKTYIVTAVFSVSSILSVLLKIAILYYTQNFILYLIVDCVITIVTSSILAMVVNRKYPFLLNKTAAVLDNETKKGIFKNVKAILLQNIGVYLVFGTDNIIISSFISVTAVGLYSNYHMLIEICRTFVNQISSNIYHSVGNLVAVENKEKVYSIYKVTAFLNFWLYSLFGILLFILLDPFVTLWIGQEFLLDNVVLLLLVIIFYERGMRNAVATIKTTAGIFHEDRFAPLIQAAVNLAVSIVLVQSIGIAGVFIGTIVSALAVPFWLTPHLVYKKVFDKSVFLYYKDYSIYAVSGLSVYFLTELVSSLFPISSFITLFFNTLLCIFVINVLYTLIFSRTDELKYLFRIGRNLLKTILERYQARKLNKNTA